MLNFSVIPLCAIGPIYLGMSREQVRQQMGEPSAVQEAFEKWGIQFPLKDMFYENAFQIEYSTDLKARVIEVSKHESYRIEFEGLDVHNEKADVVIAKLMELDEPNTEHWEYPVNQVFPELKVSIYREHGDRNFIDALGIWE